MRRSLLTLLLLMVLGPAGAQRLDPADYVYPVLNVQRYYSANFGEMRPNHFHSGVDIKTDGVEGKPVIAVADGYISRALISHTGFGRALYITLNNGVTAVYGHMSRFRDDIETYMHAERLRMQRDRIDLTFEPGRFPVKQGDVVAYSGNAGISFGPHLHYELRDTRTQRTLNLIRQGVIRPTDDIPPYILHVHYIETDTVRGVPVHSKPICYDVVKTDPQTFRLTRRDPVEIGPNGYFVVEATDRRNGVSNTFGIYRATLFFDSKPLFEYRMDGFTFDRSRDCNAASYYPIQLASRNEAIRLAAIEGACKTFCPISVNRGAVSAAEGELHTVRIEIEDDCGNTSHIEFRVKGRTAHHSEIDPAATVCDRRRRTTLTTEGARLTIPAEALYESLLLTIGRSGIRPAPGTKLPVLSPVYRLLDRTVPLKKAVEVTIKADIPEPLHPKAALGLIGPNGQITYVGGHYTQGAVTARTTTTGSMLIVADTIAPVVKPLFTPDADLSQSPNLSFRISDNFSGITSCELRIDDAWVVCDRNTMKGTATHTFQHPRSGKRHTVQLTVCDACGNKIVWKGSFIR